MERPTEAEVKAWERSVAIRKWILGLALSILALGVIALLVIQSGKQNPQLGNSEPVVSSSASTASASKEYRILQEQKTASENLTRRSVELIKENRMSEVRQVYKSRWNELATLRTNNALAHDLTAAEKQNIDQALRSDQEAITEVLEKYNQLYGP
jgi:predicted transcriptional regulator